MLHPVMLKDIMISDNGLCSSLIIWLVEEQIHLEILFMCSWKSNSQTQVPKSLMLVCSNLSAWPQRVPQKDEVES